MSVGLAHGGQAVFHSSSPAEELLVGTLDGLVHVRRSGDGEQWQVHEKSLEGKQVSALLIQPTRGVLFAGTHGHGVYASVDHGRTWHRRDLGIQFENIYMLSFVYVDGQPRLYAGTEPAHLYVSNDMGESWQEVATIREAPSVDTWTFPMPPKIAHVKHMAFDPRSPDIIYLAIEQGALLKSLDGGKSWQELGGFYQDVHRLAITPSHPARLYMAAGDGLYRSQDGGETWQKLRDTASIGYPDALLIHPYHEDTVFTAGGVGSPGLWLKSGTADARIARSRDGGRTWQRLQQGLPSEIRGNVEALSLDVRPGGFSLYAGTGDGDVFFSEDEGETWHTVARGLAPICKGPHYKVFRPPEAQPAAFGR